MKKSLLLLVLIFGLSFFFSCTPSELDDNKLEKVNVEGLASDGLSGRSHGNDEGVPPDMQ